MATHTRRAALGAIGSIAAAGLIAAHTASAQPSHEWDRLMSARDAAKATFDAYPADDDRLDQLCDLYCEAEARLMAMPAPNAAALRWKLDKLLEPEAAGSTASWSRDYVAQTTRDIARLLGGEA